jgi:hypothetical protein
MELVGYERITLLLVYPHRTAKDDNCHVNISCPWNPVVSKGPYVIGLKAEPA